MNESSSGTPLPRWKRSATLAVTIAALLLVTAFLATQALGPHYNLSYLLWKSGLGSYERRVAFAGLLRDPAYRRHFIGMPIEQFQKSFPNTFYKARTQRPNAKPNQEFYIDDYQLAQREEWFYGMGWEAVFEDGRLVEFKFFKA